MRSSGHGRRRRSVRDGTVDLVDFEPGGPPAGDGAHRASRSPRLFRSCAGRRGRGMECGLIALAHRPPRLRPPTALAGNRLHSHPSPRLPLAGSSWRGTIGAAGRSPVAGCRGRGTCRPDPSSRRSARRRRTNPDRCPRPRRTATRPCAGFVERVGPRGAAAVHDDLVGGDDVTRHRRARVCRVEHPSRAAWSPSRAASSRLPATVPRDIVGRETRGVVDDQRATAAVGRRRFRVGRDDPVPGGVVPGPRDQHEASACLGPASRRPSPVARMSARHSPAERSPDRRGRWPASSSSRSKNPSASRSTPTRWPEPGGDAGVGQASCPASRGLGAERGVVERRLERPSGWKRAVASRLQPRPWPASTPPPSDRTRRPPRARQEVDARPTAAAVRVESVICCPTTARGFEFERGAGSPRRRGAAGRSGSRPSSRRSCRPRTPGHGGSGRFVSSVPRGRKAEAAESGRPWNGSFSGSAIGMSTTPNMPTFW